MSASFQFLQFINSGSKNVCMPLVLSFSGVVAFFTVDNLLKHQINSIEFKELAAAWNYALQNCTCLLIAQLEKHTHFVITLKIYYYKK